MQGNINISNNKKVLNIYIYIYIYNIIFKHEILYSKY